MDIKYDMPTNEGSLALARSIATGAKLIIRGAKLCNVPGSEIGSVSDVATLTWERLATYALDGITIPCTSYLPSMVDYSGTETGSPIAALDLEFVYMPNSEVHYNTIAVLADMYYAQWPFKLGDGYTAGSLVWCLGNSGDYSYYICKSDVEASVWPVNDPEHWEPTTVVSTLDEKYGGLQYSTISESPVLLYVSKTPSSITISSQIEMDYKIRLYLEGVHNTESIHDFVIFDTLGLETFASTELNLLAEFAVQLSRIRDVALARASRS